MSLVSFLLSVFCIVAYSMVSYSIILKADAGEEITSRDWISLSLSLLAAITFILIAFNTHS